MASPTTDRRLGLAGNTAYKTPVTVVATANITQSGEQTIDGVAVKAINTASVPDRVLCVGMTDATKNGFWDVSTAAWTRSIDANGNYDLTTGTQVFVTSGSMADQVWALTTAAPIIVGTTSLTFTQSLSTGFLATLLAATGSGLIGFIASGLSAVYRTVLSKLRDNVSVFDYMTEAQISDAQNYSGTIDCTAAFTAAQAASNLIHVPPGAYLLDNFKQENRKVFRGAGLNNTFFKQGNINRPAWWCVSKTGTYETQIIGAELTGVWFLGKVGSTVASCIVEAITPFVVSYSRFRIGGSGGYHTLEIKTGGAFEVYSSEFYVVQQDVTGLSFGSSDTAIITGSGVYNKFWINAVGAANGIGIQDASFDCTFEHAVTDCQQIYGGQQCTIYPVVEGFTGTAKSCAILNTGISNVLINPHIINVARSKVQGSAIELSSGGGAPSTIIGLRVLGSPGAATFTGALTAANSGTLNSVFTFDTTGTYRLQFTVALTFTGALVAATSATLTGNWTSATDVCTVTFSDGSTRSCQFTNGATTCTWIGAVTATASISVLIVRAAAFTNGSTAVNWTGAVTANAAATVIHNIPLVALQMPPGNSGAVVNASAMDCPYLTEDVPNTAYTVTPTADTLSRFTFSGDCSTVTRRGGNYPDGGFVTFSSSTTAAVALTKTQPDSNYRIIAGAESNKTFWASGKTRFGFTMNASSSSSDTVSWSLFR